MVKAIFNLSGKKVWVAGHLGMVGSSLMRRLASEDCEIVAASRSELDLSRQNEVESFVCKQKPDAIIIAAAKVGGILANSSYPANFIFENLQIATNIIGAAHLHNVKKVTYLGSSCIYPKLAPQPIAEESLLTGPLEPTNEWYAVAKIAGIKLCAAFRKQYGRDYISCMPTNLYGPNDNFDLNSSHVLPALIAKAHAAKKANAKTFSIWGSGTPFREFMHVDDCADAIVFLTKYYSGDGHINVGTGEEVSIKTLAEAVKHAVGLEAELLFDTSKPDGTPRKLMDSGRLRALGFRHRISLQKGIASTYGWYCDRELAKPPAIEANGKR
jgi:GDP-L-fucose synthase